MDVGAIFFALLVVTCWIWVPALLFVPSMVWALFEGQYLWRRNGLVWCYLEEAYVTPEQFKANHIAHYGE